MGVVRMNLKVLNMIDLENTTSLRAGRLEHQYKQGEITQKEELKYRVWLHYLECRKCAGKKGIDFSTFKKHTSPFEYVELLRSTVIYTDNIVSKEEITKIFFNWE